MYKHMHNFPFLWYTVLYTLMPNTKLTSNVRESNLSPKTIPSMYLIKWVFLSKTRHLTFRLIYFFFLLQIHFLLIFVCMLIYFLGLDYTLYYPSNATSGAGCLDTFDGPENPLDIAFWPKKWLLLLSFCYDVSTINSYPQKNITEDK